MIIKRNLKDKLYLRKIGENIKVARENQRYSQASLAKGIGYKTGYSIHLIESGRVASIDTVLLARIAEFLEIPIKELLAD
jgi:transcriptional regulator with XRE-family HTH domain